MTINTKLSEAEIDKINGFWPTPVEAVLPLIPHLKAKFKCEPISYIEPCAGAGHLINILEDKGIECVWASDINPKSGEVKNPNFIAKYNALDLLLNDETGTSHEWIEQLGADYIITNPPFSRIHTKTLLDMIDIFRKHLDTWLLLPAGFAFNDNSQNAMIYCKKIVPIGRVKWVEGTEHKGSKDFAWFLFQSSPAKTEFCQKQIIKKSKKELSNV